MPDPSLFPLSQSRTMGPVDDSFMKRRKNKFVELNGRMVALIEIKNVIDSSLVTYRNNFCRLCCRHHGFKIPAIGTFISFVVVVDLVIHQEDDRNNSGGDSVPRSICAIASAHRIMKAR